MDKEEFRRQVLQKLETDRQLLLDAAKHAHATATHEDNIPDNKYETFALESSYLAQGQANRAQEIRQAIDLWRNLQMRTFGDSSEIRMSALVLLEDEDGNQRAVFLAPAAGGLVVNYHNRDVMLISPDSPLGQELIGRGVDDSFLLESGARREYEIIEIE
ncbi:GreA/GreB family elongation factor [Malonomonas rubra DSM 5091]|uniref:GreA/GreB family elongation factor n=1 Tax=Malonomonas rubra DSM 5091 TaxID=1122189 RepID=A0A1M6MLJ1_MALRU|nr:GreA/GreB family elongation factor [Malonomonas rubra]SHJ84250.1 GreA/GreB family elongation factor [Malonomonas rubra DSM 5091]